MGPSTFVFLLPFVLLRLALMVGNWGQHALVDELDPSSDLRTSITMLDVMVSPLMPALTASEETDAMDRVTVYASTMGIIQHIT